VTDYILHSYSLLTIIVSLPFFLPCMRVVKRSLPKQTLFRLQARFLYPRQSNNVGYNGRRMAKGLVVQMMTTYSTPPFSSFGDMIWRGESVCTCIPNVCETLTRHFAAARLHVARNFSTQRLSSWPYICTPASLPTWTKNSEARWSVDSPTILIEKRWVSSHTKGASRSRVLR
jgi:hypothetical protein